MRAWYANLADRERRFVQHRRHRRVRAAAAGIILPLNRSIAQARQRVPTNRPISPSSRARRRSSRAAGPASPGQRCESLVVLIDSSARESGLGKSLSSSQPTGDGGLRIRLDHAPFDGMVAWLARLSQQHGVRVESAEIEPAGEPGLVNAGLVLKGG